jgi:pimeloyl-ACP methyl ester carboxylesterase
MNVIKNYILEGRHEKVVTLDVYWKEGNNPKPIVLFAHGFKGFKDWGHWHRIAEAFAEAGYCFIKFNFSHNGVTSEDLLNFADLEAFGQNNYTKELDDLEVVLDWIEEDKDLQDKINWQAQDVTLIGHSRGGPIALIAAKENEVVKQVITWASVHELDYSWHKTSCQASTWEKDGVYYVMNGRTKQNMPLYFQLYENYIDNEARLSVKSTLEKLEKPYLILHGGADPAVPAEAAEYLIKHAQNAKLHIIQNANHVFGGSHPFDGKELPSHSQELVQQCLDFLKK